MREIKVHRYPGSIRALGINERYTTPMAVPIGPYYHGREELKQAEKMKHVAAYQCIKDSTHSVEHIYAAVGPVARGIRRLYDEDVMAVHALLMSDFPGSVVMEESLYCFFGTNANEVFHDIMLLDNQIPWPVVDTVMEFSHHFGFINAVQATHETPLPLAIYSMKTCLQYPIQCERRPFLVDNSYNYQPPHLLGLLRFYIVGRIKPQPTEEDLRTFSVSASNELAEIGIALRAANENSDLSHMGVQTKGPFFGELFLAPVYLDDARISCLLSMAALELCTTSNFGRIYNKEDSAVCSYLVLLAMLAANEEDVTKLRRQHLLQGGGLSNGEVLDFFTKIHGLRVGLCFVRVMGQIERYKHKRWMRTKLYALYYRNKPTVIKVVSVTVSAVGIIATIIGAVKHLRRH